MGDLLKLFVFLLIVSASFRAWVVHNSAEVYEDVKNSEVKVSVEATVYSPVAEVGLNSTLLDGNIALKKALVTPTGPIKGTISRNTLINSSSSDLPNFTNYKNLLLLLVHIEKTTLATRSIAENRCFWRLFFRIEQKAARKQS